MNLFDEFRLLHRKNEVQVGLNTLDGIRYMELVDYLKKKFAALLEATTNENGVLNWNEFAAAVLNVEDDEFGELSYYTGDRASDLFDFVTNWSMVGYFAFPGKYMNREAIEVLKEADVPMIMEAMS